MASVNEFTSQKRERFLALLEQGVSVTDASEKAGTTRATVSKWCRDGRSEETGDKHDFAVRFDAIRQGIFTPMPLDQDDLVRLLEAEARQGRVEAIKLLLTRPWEQQVKAEPEKPIGVVAEIAQLRAVK